MSSKSWSSPRAGRAPALSGWFCSPPAPPFPRGPCRARALLAPRAEKLGMGSYFSSCLPCLVCGFPHPFDDRRQHWDVGQESS